MYIVIIEPDKKLARTYQRTFENLGHDVSVVAHAQDAVHVADARRPDIILLELQLSAHNGIEFLYEFRSYPEWQEIPVILLTLVPPHSLQITAPLMRQLHITKCLYKPATSLKQLTAAVEEVV